MTEEEIIRTYVNYICRWYAIKPTQEIADALDLSVPQIEALVDEIEWPHFVKFKIAPHVVKAEAEDAKPACVILPFHRLTNND